MQHPSVVRPLRLLAVVLFLLLVLPLTGCGGGSSYSIESSEMARSFLPVERRLDYHPDSLGSLDVGVEEGRIAFAIDGSFREMMRAWSSSWQGIGGRSRNQRSYYHSYATLWSLELSLASLQPERGIQTLSLDLARDLLRERREEYQSIVQVDVYRYLSSPLTSGDLSSLRLRGPGRDVYLEDDQGNTYEPTRVDASRPIQTYLPSGGNTLYERNTLYFPRRVAGKDILEDVRWVRVVVREPATYDYYFTWVFPREVTST